MARLRLSYGVHESDIASFIANNQVIKQFLDKYKGRTRREYGRALCLFFSWLRKNREIDLSPKELLNQHLKKRSSPQS